MASEASIHRGLPPRRGRPKRKKVLVVVLLASALPVIAAVVVAVLPDDKRAALLAKIPEGGAGWAIAAGVAFAAMALLAWAVLPLLHHGSGWLRGIWFRLTDRPRGARVVLSPVIAAVEAAWLGLQALFAMDAFLILLAAALGLLFTIRIIEPGLLPGVAQGLW
jgi:hypothetical protein